MPVDPQRLLVLRAVRRTGSILAASRALHLTPSGVSQHLARLERETGLTLIDRSRRGGGRTVQLSPAGLALAEQADVVAASLADADREVGRLRDRSEGVVRIGGFASVLTRLVAPVVVGLGVTDPAIEPHVLEVETGQGLADLRAGRLDLLLDERAPGTPPTRPAGVVEEDLFLDQYKIVVPEVWSTPDTPERLLSGTWVTAPRDQSSRRMLDRLCAEAGVRLDSRHSCTDSRTMLALVAAGLGAAIIPDMTLSYLPTTGVRVSAAALDPGARVLTLMRPASPGPPPPATERFRSGLHELLAQRGLER